MRTPLHQFVKPSTSYCVSLFLRQALYGYSSKPKATGVHDNLTVTVYAFSYGEKKLLYINATLCVFRTDIADELRKAISEKFGIGYENVESVTMATAFGDSKIGINRRMQKEGTNSMWLGECHWGILNTKMTILSFKAADGSVKGNLVCYGAHGTSAGASTLITRDWSGYMVDALEEKTGGLTALVLGPEGDVAPRTLLDGDSRSEQTEALGAYSAKEVLRIFEDLGEYKDVSMDVKQCQVKVALLPRISKETALSKMEELKKGPMYNMQSVQYEHCNAVVQSYEEGYIERECDTFEQVVFRLGNVAFASFAFELFSAIVSTVENINSLKR